MKSQESNATQRGGRGGRGGRGRGRGRGGGRGGRGGGSARGRGNYYYDPDFICRVNTKKEVTVAKKYVCQMGKYGYFAIW